MLGGGFDWLRIQFFIAAPLALPSREDGIRSACVLIDGADGRNDLPTATRARAAARSAALDVDPKLFG